MKGALAFLLNVVVASSAKVEMQVYAESQ